ncbi:3'-5' DNA helicase [Ascosphaera acerosa]|nr:3'-5' DNA helicase [Ascosphaera acerosa]
MVDLSSDLGDLDDDLLELTKEVEDSSAGRHVKLTNHASARTRQLPDEQHSGKRRRLEATPFRKPCPPQGRLKNGRDHGTPASQRRSPASQAPSWSKQSQLTAWGFSPTAASPSQPASGIPPRASNTSASGDDDDDPDLAAAIRASLSDQQSQPAARGPDTPRTGGVARLMTADYGYETDEIPDDVFESPFRATPVRPTAAVPASPTSGSLRQSTLFGHVVPSQSMPSATTPSISFSPRRNGEPPTHHRLNRAALSTWVYPTNLGAKRDYQFNITKKALFHNLLVALPTGLGKTFIAATVMLNWFRWTTDAQIAFLAPTKPLVSQQAHACFHIAGIPRSTTTILTGETSPALRAAEWEKKRVFFMTPQTFMADLTTGIADPKRLVLLVVDEAHRATGGYAYAEAVKFLERFNHSFRVMALTATPGKEVEGVQEVIDNLRISRIEIRSEQSLDIRQYVHTKTTEKHTFENTPEMNRMLDLFSRALKPVLDKLTSQNAYWSRDPLTITPFGLTLARKKWMFAAGRHANQGIKAMVNAAFTTLSSLAHALDLLKYHGIRAFHRSLMTFKESVKGGKGGKYRRMISDTTHYKTMMDELEKMVANPSFTGSPKLDYLKEVVLNHFLDAQLDGSSASKATRIMIFAKYRDSAEDIVHVLKRAPLVKASVFVGKAKAKNSEGMAQKQQLEVVKKFKEGTYNVLVATSVGEEGLDIGEIDLIICYDSSASPISLLQRMGRTGRKRRGNIVMLFMKGKEEADYAKALDNYLNMQRRIENATEFVFHAAKAPRILPLDAQPVVDERRVEIPQENLQSTDLMPQSSKRQRGARVKRPPKKFHMPDGVITGFMTAANLHTGRSVQPPRTTSRPRVLARPQPATETVDPPLDSEILLTQQEELLLEQQYRNSDGSHPEAVQPVGFDAFPDLQRSERPVGKVAHSARTRSFVRCMRRIHDLPPDCDAAYNGLLLADDGYPPADDWSLPDDEEGGSQSDAGPEAEMPGSQMTLSQISVPDFTKMFGSSSEP